MATTLKRYYVGINMNGFSRQFSPSTGEHLIGMFDSTSEKSYISFNLLPDSL